MNPQCSAEKENPMVGRFYESLFSDLSGYVHVNVSMAEKYFKENDPYYELNEELLSGVLAMFFAHLQLYEVTKLNHVSIDLKVDMLYLAEKISGEIKMFTAALKPIEENPLFDLMDDLLAYYSESSNSQLE